MYEQQKQQVLDTAQRLYTEKMYAGTSGNVSLCNRERTHIIITPTSCDYDLMKAEDIVVIGLDGNVLEGRLKPSSEWRMHAEIYQRVPRAGAVVHTHSPYATSFAAIGQGIPVFLVEMLPFLQGSLEVSPYAVQGSAQVGIGAAAILQEKNACLLAGHGAVAIGANMREAYIHSVYVEDIAKIYHLAKCVGEPVELEHQEDGCQPAKGGT